jgi:hypothetical protein
MTLSDEPLRTVQRVLDSRPRPTGFVRWDDNDIRPVGCCSTEEGVGHADYDARLRFVGINEKGEIVIVNM